MTSYLSNKLFQCTPNYSAADFSVNTSRPDAKKEHPRDGVSSDLLENFYKKLMMMGVALVRDTSWPEHSVLRIHVKDEEESMMFDPNDDDFVIGENEAVAKNKDIIHLELIPKDTIDSAMILDNNLENFLNCFVCKSTVFINSTKITSVVSQTHDNFIDSIQFAINELALSSNVENIDDATNISKNDVIHFFDDRPYEADAIWEKAYTQHCLPSSILPEMTPQIVQQHTRDKIINNGIEKHIKPAIYQMMTRHLIYSGDIELLISKEKSPEEMLNTFQDVVKKNLKSLLKQDDSNKKNATVNQWVKILKENNILPEDLTNSIFNKSHYKHINHIINRIIGSIKSEDVKTRLEKLEREDDQNTGYYDEYAKHIEKGVFSFRPKYNNISKIGVLYTIMQLCASFVNTCKYADFWADDKHRHETDTMTVWVTKKELLDAYGRHGKSTGTNMGTFNSVLSKIFQDTKEHEMLKFKIKKSSADEFFNLFCPSGCQFYEPVDAHQAMTQEVTNHLNINIEACGKQRPEQSNTNLRIGINPTFYADENEISNWESAQNIFQTIDTKILEVLLTLFPFKQASGLEVKSDIKNKDKNDALNNPIEHPSNFAVNRFYDEYDLQTQPLSRATFAEKFWSEIVKEANLYGHPLFASYIYKIHSSIDFKEVASVHEVALNGYPIPGVILIKDTTNYKKGEDRFILVDLKNSKYGDTITIDIPKNTGYSNNNGTDVVNLLDFMTVNNQVSDFVVAWRERTNVFEEFLFPHASEDAKKVILTANLLSDSLNKEDIEKIILAYLFLKNKPASSLERAQTKSDALKELLGEQPHDFLKIIDKKITAPLKKTIWDRQYNFNDDEIKTEFWSNLKAWNDRSIRTGSKNSEEELIGKFSRDIFQNKGAIKCKNVKINGFDIPGVVYIEDSKPATQNNDSTSIIFDIFSNDYVALNPKSLKIVDTIQNLQLIETWKKRVLEYNRIFDDKIDTKAFSLHIDTANTTATTAKTIEDKVIEFLFARLLPSASSIDADREMQIYFNTIKVNNDITLNPSIVELFNNLGKIKIMKAVNNVKQSLSYTHRGFMKALAYEIFDKFKQTGGADNRIGPKEKIKLFQSRMLKFPVPNTQGAYRQPLTVIDYILLRLRAPKQWKKHEPLNTRYKALVDYLKDLDVQTIEDNAVDRLGNVVKKQISDDLNYIKNIELTSTLLTIFNDQSTPTHVKGLIDDFVRNKSKATLLNLKRGYANDALLLGTGNSRVLINMKDGGYISLIDLDAIQDELVENHVYSQETIEFIKKYCSDIDCNKYKMLQQKKVEQSIAILHFLKDGVPLHLRRYIENRIAGFKSLDTGYEGLTFSAQNDRQFKFSEMAKHLADLHMENMLLDTKYFIKTPQDIKAQKDVEAYEKLWPMDWGLLVGMFVCAIAGIVAPPAGVICGVSLVAAGLGKAIAGLHFYRKLNAAMGEPEENDQAVTGLVTEGICIALNLLFLGMPVLKVIQALNPLKFLSKFKLLTKKPIAPPNPAPAPIQVQLKPQKTRVTLPHITDKKGVRLLSPRDIHLKSKDLKELKQIFPNGSPTPNKIKEFEYLTSIEGSLEKYNYNLKLLMKKMPSYINNKKITAAQFEELNHISFGFTLLDKKTLTRKQRLIFKKVNKKEIDYVFSQKKERIDKIINSNKNELLNPSDKDFGKRMIKTMSDLKSRQPFNKQQLLIEDDLTKRIDTHNMLMRSTNKKLIAEGNGSLKNTLPLDPENGKMMTYTKMDDILTELNALKAKMKITPLSVQEKQRGIFLSLLEKDIGKHYQQINELIPIAKAHVYSEAALTASRADDLSMLLKFLTHMKKINKLAPDQFKFIELIKNKLEDYILKFNMKNIDRILNLNNQKLLPLADEKFIKGIIPTLDDLVRYESKNIALTSLHSKLLIRLEAHKNLKLSYKLKNMLPKEYRGVKFNLDANKRPEFFRSETFLQNFSIVKDINDLSFKQLQMKTTIDFRSIYNIIDIKKIINHGNNRFALINYYISKVALIKMASAIPHEKIDLDLSSPESIKILKKILSQITEISNENDLDEISNDLLRKIKSVDISPLALKRLQKNTNPNDILNKNIFIQNDAISKPNILQDSLILPPSKKSLVKPATSSATQLMPFDFIFSPLRKMADLMQLNF